MFLRSDEVRDAKVASQMLWPPDFIFDLEEVSNVTTLLILSNYSKEVQTLQYS